MVTLPRGPLGIEEIGEGIEHDSHSVIPHENRLFFPNSKVRTETQFTKRTQSSRWYFFCIVISVLVYWI